MAQTIDPASGQGPLGIIAGGGWLPVAIAESVLAQGRPVFIVGLAEASDAGISPFPHERLSFGQLTSMMKVFRNKGCRELVIVGTATRPQLSKLRIDFGGVKAIPYFLKIALGGDDKLLSGIVRYFEHHGVIVRGTHDVAPHLVANAGTIGRYRPTADDEADARMGQRVIATLGPFDVGQGVVVARRRVIAIEAAEGTDRMLTRCGEIAHWRAANPSKRNGVFVKMPKPQQDIRVDTPTIGPETVKRADAAGLRGIVIGASGVLIAARDETIAAADAAGLFLAGFDWPSDDD